MADALVARPRMHCQGHVAHGISRLYHEVEVSTRFTQPWATHVHCTVQHVTVIKPESSRMHNVMHNTLNYATSTVNANI